MTWLITVRPGKRRLLDPAKPTDALTEQHKRMKAGIRVRIEHPFRVPKRQFRFVKVRHRGVLKSTAQLQTMFALVNLWIGATQTAGSLGMSAPVVRQMGQAGAQYNTAGTRTEKNKLRPHCISMVQRVRSFMPVLCRPS